MINIKVGNYIGGIIADKEKLKRNVKYILMISGISVLLIPLMQNTVLGFVIGLTKNIKIVRMFIIIVWYTIFEGLKNL